MNLTESFLVHFAFFFHWWSARFSSCLSSVSVLFKLRKTGILAKLGKRWFTGRLQIHGIINKYSASISADIQLFTIDYFPKVDVNLFSKEFIYQFWICKFVSQVDKNQKLHNFYNLNFIGNMLSFPMCHCFLISIISPLLV